MPTRSLSDPSRLRTVVIDDDPTGTQCATGVEVLFAWEREELVRALRAASSVYVLTNTRSVDEPAAVALVREIRENAIAAADELGCEVQFVLRGDSTLRGHVFAEAEQFMGAESLLVFVPAFPAGGRTTVGGVHYVEVGGRNTPANETEFAGDPVFPFTGRTLVEYVREKSDREPLAVSLETVRRDGLSERLLAAPAGAVILPDAEVDEDISRIAAAIVEARGLGRDIVVRGGAPIAAALAGVVSTVPFVPDVASRRVLLVCGSHTLAASAQLRAVEEVWGPMAVLDTDAALREPRAAGHELAVRAAGALREGGGLAAIATERARRTSHDTLEHGRRVMEALMTAVVELAPEADLVVSKGGITSAEIARVGIGASSALVLGQIVAGVSVWRMTDRSGREVDLVVVPGNVGGDDTLVDILDRYAVPARTLG